MANTTHNSGLVDQQATLRDAERFRWLCSQIELGNLVISHQTKSGTKPWQNGVEAVIKAIDDSISVTKSLEQMNSHAGTGW